MTFQEEAAQSPLEFGRNLETFYCQGAIDNYILIDGLERSDYRQFRSDLETLGLMIAYIFPDISITRRLHTSTISEKVSSSFSSFEFSE